MTLSLLPPVATCRETFREPRRPPRPDFRTGPDEWPPDEMQIAYDEYRCFMEAGHAGPHVGARDGAPLGEAKEWARRGAAYQLLGAALRTWTAPASAAAPASPDDDPPLVTR